jgi:cytochrome c-type biogenesis protein CcmH
MIRPTLRISLLVVLATAALVPPMSTAATPPPRASLTDIENDVMCVECRESLAVAQSGQADSERAYIRGLIAQGLTKQQIEQDLVAQYGEAVLGKPPANGLNLTVYILPPAILVAGLITLAVTLPRWRRRTRAAAAQAAPAPSPPPLDPAEAERLANDLAHYRG